MYLARQLNEGSVFGILASFSLFDRNQSGFIDHSTLIEGTVYIIQPADQTKLCKRN